MSTLQQNSICYGYSEQIYFKVAVKWEPEFFSVKISSRQNFSLEQSSGTKYREKLHKTQVLRILFHWRSRWSLFETKSPCFSSNVPFPLNQPYHKSGEKDASAENIKYHAAKKTSICLVWLCYCPKEKVSFFIEFGRNWPIKGRNCKD